MVEPIAEGFGAMSLFQQIPNKKPKHAEDTNTDVWPQFGDQCEVNLFFRNYSSAEGWLGDRYIIIWSRKELTDFRSASLGVFPEKYYFFASDGGGTQFGFFDDGTTVQYISAPNIGDEEDIRILGSWKLFLRAVETGDYI